MNKSHLSKDLTARLLKAMYFIISTSKKVTTQKEFASAIGTDEYRISKYKAGTAVPTTEDILTLIDTFPISAEWLMRGTGEMVLQEPGDPIIAIQQVVGEVRRLRIENVRLKAVRKPGTKRSNHHKYAASVKSQPLRHR